MFKDKYKACFDDIKGDSALLAEILDKAVMTEKSSKRIKFVRITKYAASVAAAVVVVVSSAVLYNNGFLEANVADESLRELKTVQNGAVEQNNAEKYKTSDNTSDKTALNVNEEAEKAEKQNENIKYKADKNANDNKNENTVKVENSPSTASENISAEADISKENSENLKAVAASVVTEENLMEQADSATDESGASDRENIAVASITDESGENTEERKMLKAAGGGGGSASSARTVSEEATFEAYNSAETNSENASEKNYNEKLSVFKEGIMNIPESEYSDENKKVLVYTNEDKTKRIEITFVKKSDEKPIDTENVSVLEIEGGYVTVKAENITESYLAEIISEFSKK